MISDKTLGILGIAIDSADYVYVTESLNDCVQKFTSDGTYVTQWGSYGSGDGLFDQPFGIVVDSSGYVYVADSCNHRIQKFEPEGPLLMDGNDDCYIDLLDFAIMANEWLECGNPFDPDCGY